jgi:hypothetical protein
MDYLDEQEAEEKTAVEEEVQEIEEELAEEGGIEAEVEAVNVRTAVQFLGLASVATVLPFVIHIQLLTGPIVNAILILLLFLVGIRSALLISLVPSIMALAGGLLPAPLAPAVPFIMLSNVLFILTIDQLRYRFNDEQKGYWAGVFVGAGLKFLLLYFSVQFIVRLLLKKELAAAVTQLMSWPQFLTAVAGGAIAWGFLKWLKKI